MVLLKNQNWNGIVEEAKQQARNWMNIKLKGNNYPASLWFLNLRDSWAFFSDLLVQL